MDKQNIEETTLLRLFDVMVDYINDKMGMDTMPHILTRMPNLKDGNRGFSSDAQNKLFALGMYLIDEVPSCYFLLKILDVAQSTSMHNHVDEWGERSLFVDIINRLHININRGKNDN